MLFRSDTCLNSLKDSRFRAASSMRKPSMTISKRSTFLPRRVCLEARFRSRPAGPERWPQLMRPRLSATGMRDSMCQAGSLHDIIQGRTSIRSRKSTIWSWSMRGWHSIATIHRLNWRFGRRTCLTRTITSWLSIRPSRATLQRKQRLEPLLEPSCRHL